MLINEQTLRARCEEFCQSHLFRFWDQLDTVQRDALLHDIAQVDFPLMRRLTDLWIVNTPAPEHFERIDPVPVIPIVDPARADASEALAAGEKALRAGRVGLFLVAGGQGTRLGFDGPKGAYPIGPISKRSLFAFHAEKIQNLRRRYGCTLPWYIMVSEANNAETDAFFREHDHFGLGEENVRFLTQRMVPCVADDGRFLLEEPHRLAMNPNGHGGCLPAMQEKGVLDDCAARGIDTLSYFQVDNWSVKVADPYFIGYHILRGAKMSSKNHRKREPREAVGVHCLCDSQYRVIEYSELDLYPQLLECDAQGNVIHFAGNPAIHLINTRFVREVCHRFDEFPWHLAHKKVPYIDDAGNRVSPEKPNAYKFETFVFDALRYSSDATAALEIAAPGEYTPIKSFSGDNSVESAWRVAARYWAEWLEAAGAKIPRDADGTPTISIEISPQFALSKDEFLSKTHGYDWPATGGIALDPDGKLLSNPPQTPPAV